MILYFLLVAVTLVLGEECPHSCECNNYNNSNTIFTTVECDGDLNVTYRFPATTRKLVFHHVNEWDVGYAFEYLNDYYPPNLTEVSITHSSLIDVSNISFASLKKLQSLRLSDCQLVSVPLLNTTELSSLDLTHNKIQAILNELNQLTQLKFLNVSANSINKLEAESFQGLTSLKILDLADNNLDHLGENIFLPLLALQHLNLSRNRLETLNEACFASLLHLQQLDLSENKLAGVSPGTLELPSLARLMLAGNPNLGISKEPGLLVGTGRKLQTVDVSYIGLKQVPAALTHSIRSLRLVGNSIRLVKCGDLDSYPLLQLLDLSENNLESIEDDALGRLEALTIIYLTNNHLKAIPKSLPEHLSVLHLERNNISKIQKKDLEGLSALEVLLLSDNSIAMIQEGAFNELESLSTLDLSRNPLKILPAGSLTGPTELRVLILSQIDLIPIVEDMTFPLSTPDHLIFLDLSFSPGLSQQFLMDSATLAAAKELQKLFLTGCNIEYIRSDLLHYLPQLRDLLLDNNPLNCTNLHWLAQWMRKQPEDAYQKIICSSPAELWGTLLVDLQVTEPDTTFLSVESISSLAPNIKKYESNNAIVRNIKEQIEYSPTLTNRINSPNTSEAKFSPPNSKNMSDGFVLDVRKTIAENVWANPSEFTAGYTPVTPGFSLGKTDEKIYNKNESFIKNRINGESEKYNEINTDGDILLKDDINETNGEKEKIILENQHTLGNNAKLDYLTMKKEGILENNSTGTSNISGRVNNQPQAYTVKEVEVESETPTTATTVLAKGTTSGAQLRGKNNLFIVPKEPSADEKTGEGEIQTEVATTNGSRKVAGSEITIRKLSEYVIKYNQSRDPNLLKEKPFDLYFRKNIFSTDVESKRSNVINENITIENGQKVEEENSTANPPHVKLFTTTALEHFSTTYPIYQKELSEKEAIQPGNATSSKFSGEFLSETSNYSGVLLVLMCVIGAATAIAVIATNIARKRYFSRILSAPQEDIEVSSLPSVTELW